MKHGILLALISMLSSLQLYAQVQFKKLSDWELIKKTAVAERKLIFIDAYTDWCTFCKEMDKTTFIDTAVARVLHSKFVCVKMEMEKDPLGKKIAMKYMVNSFPSFLIFDAEGKLLYKLFGAEKPADFIQTIEQTLSKPRVLRSGYNHTNLDIKFPEFYVAAFAENGKRKFPSDSLVNAYLATQKNLFDEAPMDVMLRFAPQLKEKYLNILLDEKSRIVELYGDEVINSSLWNVLYKRMNKLVKDQNTEGFALLESRFANFLNEDPLQRQFFYADYYKLSENWERLVANIVESKSSGMSLGSNFMNSAAWDMYLKCESVELLKVACEWMNEIVVSSPEYAYLDTYAALLYKIGDHKQALMYAEQAIVTGKKQGKEVKETEELIQKIDQALSNKPQDILKAE